MLYAMCSPYGNERDGAVLLILSYLLLSIMFLIHVVLSSTCAWLLMLIGRQHYRLYAIKHIPSLKTLDYTKITKTERERAERLANSAAGAALESDVQAEANNGTNNTKTFVPGEGTSAKETFVTSFTKDQKEQIRQMVANAKSPTEIEEIERSVKRGIFPMDASNGNKRALEEESDETATNGSATKKSRV
jgi:hypothetical protein